MAEIIYPNGETLGFEFEGEKPTLAALQAAVEGYIQIVKTNDGRFLICNEEGKLKNLEPNHVATELYEHGQCDAIVGNAVILNGDEME